MKSTFRILFLARWELKKKDGRVPLCARITIDGEKVKFSLKSEVSSAIWDPKSGRAKGQTKEALQLNRYLDSIKGQMITHYHSLSEANEIVTASMLRDAFLGTNIKNNTLLTVFEAFNDRQEKLIGIDIAQSTYKTSIMRNTKESLFLIVFSLSISSSFFICFLLLPLINLYTFYFNFLWWFRQDFSA